MKIGLVKSRQSYCNNKRVQFFWPTLDRTLSKICVFIIMTQEEIVIYILLACNQQLVRKSKGCNLWNKLPDIKSITMRFYSCVFYLLFAIGGQF